MRKRLQASSRNPSIDELGPAHVPAVAGRATPSNLGGHDAKPVRRFDHQIDRTFRQRHDVQQANSRFADVACEGRIILPKIAGSADADWLEERETAGIATIVIVIRLGLCAK